jgi:hypothetical protein
VFLVEPLIDLMQLGQQATFSSFELRRNLSQP